MSRQEIHVHLHLEPSESKEVFNPHPIAVKASAKATSPESELTILMTRTLWERYMFAPFTKGLNPWINLQSARQAAAAGQSVEVMGYEMDEARIAGQTVEELKHTKGSIVTPDDLTDFMIEKGFKIGEKYGISRELIELYLTSRIDLLGQAWALTKNNTSQLCAKVYQRELPLAS